MITKTQSYKTSDGTILGSFDEAQAYELADELKDVFPNADSRKEIIKCLIGHKERIVDILTMKPNSLPAARKINGGTKKRTKRHIADQTTLPFVEPTAPAELPAAQSAK
jgi:hypothetical protein